MFDINFTFLFTAINLAVLYWFVRKYLFFRLAKKMDERSAAIAADLKLGEELKTKTADFDGERAEWQKETASRQKAILDDAKVKAEREATGIVHEAMQEAVRIKEEAKAQTEREQTAMRLSLTEETVRLAIAAASGVLGENMDGERNRKLAESFISNEEKAS